MEYIFLGQPVLEFPLSQTLPMHLQASYLFFIYFVNLLAETYLTGWISHLAKIGGRKRGSLSRKKRHCVSHALVLAQEKFHMTLHDIF